MTSPAERLSGLTTTQFGAANRFQATGIGVDKDALRRMVKRGGWKMETPRVVVSTSSTDSFERRVTVARLDAGCLAGLSHESVAAFYGVAGFELEPITMSRARKSRRTSTEAITWHHPRYLPRHHLLMVNGLVVTTPARMIADLANLPYMSDQRLERIADNTWGARLLNRAHLVTMADEWCERGRRGSTFLHRYLESRPIDWQPAASNVARRFIQLIKEAGMPEPRSEVNVGDAVRWLGRVDCLDPELPLVAEIDSDRWHTAPLDVAADEQRQRGIENGGFEVETFREHEVWHQPRSVIDRWRAARLRVRRNLVA
jgi:hypothetical protein